MGDVWTPPMPIESGALLRELCGGRPMPPPALVPLGAELVFAPLVLHRGGAVRIRGESRTLPDEGVTGGSPT